MRINKTQTISVRDIRVDYGIPARWIRLQDPSDTPLLSEHLIRDLTVAILEVPDSILILSSAGRNFCGGLDLFELCECLEAEPSARRLLEPLILLYRQFAAHPSPTISLIRGIAVGGALGLAMCADVVVTKHDANFIIPDDLRYRELAKVFVPILNQRRRAEFTTIRDWFEIKTFSGKEASEWFMANFSRDFPDEESMLGIALDALKDRTGAIAGGIPPRLSVSCLRLVDEAYDWAIDSKAAKGQLEASREWVESHGGRKVRVPASMTDPLDTIDLQGIQTGITNLAAEHDRFVYNQH